MIGNVVRGIDVGQFNGDINWAVVGRRGSVSFAYVKATEGSNSQDPKFLDNYVALKQHRIVRGAYHFFHARQSVEQQCKNFLSVLKALEVGDLPPALHVESTDGMKPTDVVERVGAWLEAVGRELQCTPLIHTSAQFWNDNVRENSNLFTQYPLWVSEHCDKWSPSLPTGALNYTFWQYSSRGKIEGIPGCVDLDRYIGTLEDLKNLCCR